MRLAPVPLLIAVLFALPRIAVAAPAPTPLAHADAASLEAASRAVLVGKSKITFAARPAKGERPGVTFAKSNAPHLVVTGASLAPERASDLAQIESLRVPPAPPVILGIQSADGTAQISASKTGVIWGKNLGGYINGKYVIPTILFSQTGCNEVKAATVTWISADGTELNFTAHGLRMKAPADANSGFFAGPAPDAYANVTLTNASGSASTTAEYEYDLQDVSVTVSVNAFPPYLISDASGRIFKTLGSGNIVFGQPTQFYTTSPYAYQTPEEKFHPALSNPSARIFPLTGAVDGSDHYNLVAVNGYSFSPYVPPTVSSPLSGSDNVVSVTQSVNGNGTVSWSLRSYMDNASYALTLNAVSGPVGFRPFLSMSKQGGMCEQ